MPSTKQSYAGRDFDIYFFKPSHELHIIEYLPLIEQGYKCHMAKDGKHIYLLFLKVKQ